MKKILLLILLLILPTTAFSSNNEQLQNINNFTKTLKRCTNEYNTTVKTCKQIKDYDEFFARCTSVSAIDKQIDILITERVCFSHIFSEITQKFYSKNYDKMQELYQNFVKNTDEAYNGLYLLNDITNSQGSLLEKLHAYRKSNDVIYNYINDLLSLQRNYLTPNND